MAQAHKLTCVGSNSEEANFACSATGCDAVVNFAKPGKGEPQAIAANGTWEPPPNFMTWMDPCIADELAN